MPECELCNPKKETERIEELPAGFDFNVFRCRAHYDFMIVSKHHGEWEPHERQLVEILAGILFPGKQIRWEQQAIRDHPHVHIVGS